MEQTNPPTSPENRVWTLSDGHAGNVRQAQALARALVAEDFIDLRLTPHAPWRWWAPRDWPGSDRAFGEDFAQRLEQPPALAIGCGRQAALATRRLRAHGARAVQILDPRIATRHWDWIIAPAHDGLHGDNVITVQGSLHDVDDAWLQRARTAFADIAALPGPRTAVLIGGASAHFHFDAAVFGQLADQLDAMADAGSLLITASRRTPDDVRTALRTRYAARAGVLWIDERDGANPYAGLLACTDRIVCTPDSVNMLSEACATRAPVYVFAPDRLRGRPRQFLDHLIACGRARALETTLAPYEIEPLRETARVAALLRERLGF